MVLEYWSTAGWGYWAVELGGVLGHGGTSSTAAPADPSSVSCVPFPAAAATAASDEREEAAARCLQSGGFTIRTWMKGLL